MKKGYKGEIKLKLQFTCGDDVFVNGGNVVGSCHHGMARPQLADRGTASDKVGSCE